MHGYIIVPLTVIGRKKQSNLILLLFNLWCGSVGGPILSSFRTTQESLSREPHLILSGVEMGAIFGEAVLYEIVGYLAIMSRNCCMPSMCGNGYKKKISWDQERS